MPTIFQLNARRSGMSFAFLGTLCSGSPPAPNSLPYLPRQQNMSSLIFCITLFNVMLGDIHIPAQVSDGTHIPMKLII